MAKNKMTRCETLIEQLALVGNVVTGRQPSARWVRVTYNNHVVTGEPMKREQDYYLWINIKVGAVRRGPTLYQSDSCPNLAAKVLEMAELRRQP